MYCRLRTQRCDIVLRMPRHRRGRRARNRRRVDRLAAEVMAPGLANAAAIEPFTFYAAGVRNPSRSKPVLAMGFRLK
jgi:hypothetical protein